MSDPVLVTRNQRFNAIFDVVNNVGWGGRAFVTKSRKWREPSSLSSSERPAVFQIEPVEGFTQTTGVNYKRTFDVLWLVYFDSDVNDPGDVASATMSDFLDAIERALAPDGPDATQTLGGLVHHVFIADTIHKVSGDDTGLGVVIVPLRIIGP